MSVTAPYRPSKPDVGGSMPSPALLVALRDRLGPRGFIDDPDLVDPWLTDWRGLWRGRTAAMLSPASTDDVAWIVARAAADGVALVPQGGNSGMVGGATPPAAGTALLVSLRRMNRVRAIDPVARTVVADAGVVLASLHDAVAARAMRFPLTLGGKGSATVGGLVATNAGGTQVLRHGTMRQLTVGIEAVLPDGSVHHGLSPLRKDNRGVDPRQLLIGSEGTLGIITAATLALSPAIRGRAVAWVTVPDPHAALALLGALDDALGAALEGYELIPEDAVLSVCRHIAGTRRPVATPGPWHVLIEAVTHADDDAIGERLADALAPRLAAGVLTDAVVAPSEAAADAMWAIRDAISLAERTAGPALQHDVSVPVAAMPDFIADAARAVADRFAGATTVAFGHLGDGNVHYHVRPPAADPDAAGWVAAHARDVARLVYGMAHDRGGSLSAEHGIGQMKRALLAELSAPARMTVVRGVKTALDPRGLMNPGTLVP